MALKQTDKLRGKEIRTRAELWRKRLRDRMEELHITQQKLADSVNDRYKELGLVTNYGQSNASDWSNAGDGKPFPRFEDIVQIAHVLGKSVEYMTGGTDYDSLNAEFVGRYLGISNEAVRELRCITKEFGSHFPDLLNLDDFDPEAVYLVNSILTSGHFKSAVRKLRGLHLVRDRPDRSNLALDRVRARHGKDIFDKGMFVNTNRCLPFQLYRPDSDGSDLLTYEEYWDMYKDVLAEGGISFEELPEAVEISNEIDEAYDEGREDEIEMDLVDTAYRYQAKFEFGAMVDEILPPLSS